jgi:hypothetical protein
VSPGVIHCAFFVIVMIIFLCPLDYFHRPTRKYFFRVLLLVLLTPLVREGFPEFFIADILCSSVRVIYDFTYAGCFYFTGWFIDPHGTRSRPDLPMPCPALCSTLHPP